MTGEACLVSLSADLWYNVSAIFPMSWRMFELQTYFDSLEHPLLYLGTYHGRFFSGGKGRVIPTYRRSTFNKSQDACWLVTDHHHRTPAIPKSSPRRYLTWLSFLSRF